MSGKNCDCACTCAEQDKKGRKSFLDVVGLAKLIAWIRQKMADMQELFVRKDGLKTVGGNSLIGSGDIPLPTTKDYSGDIKDLSDGMDDLKDALDKKQDKLVSGTSLKTINGESLLGSGNITITSGSGVSGSDTTLKSVTIKEV